MVKQKMVGLACVLAASVGMAKAQEAPAPLRALATFSVLADLVREVGGERVAVEVLVTSGQDAHTFAPKPAHVRRLAEVAVVFANGMGFDPWIDRLLKAAAFRGEVVVASQGTVPLPNREAHAGHAHAATSDPHVWQDPQRVKNYVQQIARGLCRSDAAGCPYYEARAHTYQQGLDSLHRDIQSAWQAVPPAQRWVVTAHDAFAYYAQAYRVRFVAPQGITTEAEPSPQGVARLIRQLRQDKPRALFVENIADPRLLEQIARETQTRVSTQRLYSDALAPDGPASTYLGMMRYNTEALLQAVKGP